MNVSTHRCCAKSHTFTAASPPPDAREAPLGLKSTAATQSWMRRSSSKVKEETKGKDNAGRANCSPRQNKGKEPLLGAKYCMISFLQKKKTKGISPDSGCRLGLIRILMRFGKDSIPTAVNTCFFSPGKSLDVTKGIVTNHKNIKSVGCQH